MYCQSVPDLRFFTQQWQVKLYALSESYRACRPLADRVLDDGNVSGYCFLLWCHPVKFICTWMWLDEGITFGGMKVRL